MVARLQPQGEYRPAPFARAKCHVAAEQSRQTSTDGESEAVATGVRFGLTHAKEFLEQM